MSKADAATEPVVQLAQFEVIRRLGAGGMGVVFLGEHIDLRRRPPAPDLAPWVENHWVLRWDLPGRVVDRRIRAVTPNPGAWTMIGDLRVKVGPVTISGPRSRRRM